MNYGYLKLGKAVDLADPADRVLYRFFEILPGALAWLTIAGIFFASWLAPMAASFFIIAFDLYWLFKTVFLSIHLRAGYREMRRRMSVNWLEKLDSLRQYPPELNIKTWREVRHVVILPFYKESYALVRDAVEAVRRSDYKRELICLVLAVEERAGAEAREIAERLKKEYEPFFWKMLISIHPYGLPEEMPGKGSNETWAARMAAEEIIKKEAVPLEHVLVSSFDIDTQAPVGYFALLTYEYLVSAHPLRSSYQPIPIYNNNIWDSPAFSRVVATSGTFWQTMQQARPERLTTFSSHSIAMKTLADIGYWPVNVVSEDSRIFWKSFLFYDGDYRVVPLFYPVYMDANVAPTLWATAKNVYKQQRRWGWGVENIPYLLFGFWKNKRIPFRKKIYFVFNQLEGFWAWATNALLLFFLGWLPLFLGGAHFGTTVLSYNLPRVTRSIMTLAMVGLVTSAIISTALLPRRPAHKPVRAWFWMVLQWVMVPLTIVLFGSFPGIEAQTRLMLGKYMSFWVTPKFRRQHSESR